MIQQPLVAVLFIAAVAVVSCGRSGDTENRVLVARSEKKETARSNADLENAVRAKFKTDEQLRSADLGVKVDAANEITLSGSVESETLRVKAVDLAKSVESGVIINDQIEVKPSGRTAGNSNSDRLAYA